MTGNLEFYSPLTLTLSPQWERGQNVPKDDLGTSYIKRLLLSRLRASIKLFLNNPARRPGCC